jgi:tetratricopeptide (TPR) repeat protein
MKLVSQSLRRIAQASLAPLLLLSLSCSTLSDGERAANKGAPAVDGIGSNAFPVTAANVEARRLFHQGMQLLYAFEQPEAARSFRAAWAMDPSCAMCAWGVAYALGPNINQTERQNLPEIRRYIERAQAASGKATPLEQALVQALAVRYGRADETTQKQVQARAEAMCSKRPADRTVDPLEFAYAQAMTEVLAAHPADPDVVTLYADAVMVTSPWDWWDRKTGQPSGAMGGVVDRLVAAREVHSGHTGLAHFLIHAAEQSPKPQRAEGAADALAALAPGAPHLVHMPSHIYVHSGRFHEASTVNQRALAVQKTYHEAISKQDFKPGFNWDFHHLHFLWYAALMEGRGDLALANARTLSERYGNSPRDGREYLRALPLHTLVRLQRWDEILADPPPSEGLGFTEGMWHFARGMAMANTGRLAEAQKEAAQVARLRELPTLKRARINDEPTLQWLLQVSAAVLDAEILRARGNASAAEQQAVIEVLRAAVELEEDKIGGEPPGWAVTARLALAQALLAAGRPAEAEAEYRAFDKRNPDSGWALRGLVRTYEAQGKAADAQAARVRLASAWSRADGALLSGS